MQKKKMLGSLLTLLLVCVLAAGCSLLPIQLTEQTVRGPLYTLSIQLPYEFAGEMKEQQLQANTQIYISKFADAVDKPMAEDVNLVEFTALDFDQDSLQQEFGDVTTAEGKQKFSNFGAQFVARYVAAMTKGTGIENPNMDSHETTIAGRRATVTQVDGKLKGEDERLQVIYIEDPQEAWLITLGYPKQNADGIGKKITEEIIPNLQLLE